MTTIQQTLEIEEPKPEKYLPNAIVHPELKANIRKWLARANIREWLTT